MPLSLTHSLDEAEVVAQLALKGEVVWDPLEVKILKPHVNISSPWQEF